MPDGTKSFALVLLDPEGRAPAGVSHMVLYGIPADVKGFPEGELSQPSEKFVGGKNLMGTGTYFGPGTPPNTDWHHYTFTLVATDLALTSPCPDCADRWTNKNGAVESHPVTQPFRDSL